MASTYFITYNNNNLYCAIFMLRNKKKSFSSCIVWYGTPLMNDNVIQIYNTCQVLNVRNDYLKSVTQEKIDSKVR